MTSRYRWAALALTMLVNAPLQTLWISYSPVTPQAAAYYGVGDFAVVVLSMTFMVVYVLASLPASHLVDTRGVRTAVGLGGLLVGGCGLARGLAGHSYPLALAATVGIAVGQPLVLNAWTAMPAQWFPPQERSAAVGLTTVANIAGTAAGLVAPPVLLGRLGVGGMQTLFGAVALAAALAYLAFYRDGTPPAGQEGKALVVAGMRHAFSVAPFRLLLACSLLGMGVFSALTSLTAEMVAPLGLGPSEAGTAGAAMLAGGLVGAVVVPRLSGALGRQALFVGLGMVTGGVAVAGFALASSAAAVDAAAAAVGVFLVPLLPIGMEYGAELVHPTPDGTSNGIMQIGGQASVVVVGLLWAARGGDGSFTAGLLATAGLLVVAGVVCLRRLPEIPPGTTSPPTGAPQA